jgi:hypothetical protein
MSKKTKNQTTNDNVISNVDFGTTQPNTTRVTEEEMLARQQLFDTYLTIGMSVLEWATYATKEQYIKHMEELYDCLHQSENNSASNIETPKKQIILPN